MTSIKLAVFNSTKEKTPHIELEDLRLYWRNIENNYSNIKGSELEMFLYEAKSPRVIVNGPSVVNYAEIVQAILPHQDGAFVFFESEKGGGTRVDVYNGKILILINLPYYKKRGKLDNVLNHESHHAVHAHAQARGHKTIAHRGAEVGYIPIDTVLCEIDEDNEPVKIALEMIPVFPEINWDITHTRNGKKYRWVRYFKDKDIYEEGGNRHIGLKLLRDSGYFGDRPLWFKLRRKLQLLLDLLTQIVNEQGLLSPLERSLWKNDEIISFPFGAPAPYLSSGIHNGADFLVPLRTPIYAPEAGSMTLTRALSRTAGNYGVYEFYYKGEYRAIRCLHLFSKPKEGNYRKGDIIGYTGSTGLSISRGQEIYDTDNTRGVPHLHIEVWKSKYDLSKIVTKEGVYTHLADPVRFF